MNYNLADLTPAKRELIELDKHAALLIHNLRMGKISRHDVTQEIEKVCDDNRDYFKQKLNGYMKR